MNIVEHLTNIYLNLYIKKGNISYLSPPKNLFKLINSLVNTGSVLIVVLTVEKYAKCIIKLPNKEYF
ncbi:hypothetical protein YYC_00045 [Plasmodium yoelii 17X]|uniref:Uncharacterized protein n=1 Tax=Plasmodium yoelii 17X TaxID=1323249 RepID=V7PVB7_PLAYE|nr:hypothetical protein YYC_00045 [Plasmodium yoelii 17X]